MRETQVTIVIVAPQALTNGVEVVKPIIHAHSRACSCQRPLRCRPNVESQPDHASNDNYDICLDSAHIVDAEWLSGRMPDSRAREHRHESSYGLHTGAVDGDSLWRCYAMTTQNHCTCYFVINRDLFYFI